MARSKAASRVSESGDEMVSSIDALIGDFTSSAKAVADQAPARIIAPASATPLLIDDQRVERGLLQLVPAAEKRELDHEGDPDDLPAELAYQPQSCRHRTTGREEVIDREHTLAALDPVLVHCECVASVLELVLHLDRLARKLARLAHRHETRLQLMCERAAQDEAARFDPDDDVDALGLVAPGERVDDELERGAVLEKGRDVLEEDAFRREVLDVADLPLELGDVHRPPSYLNAAVRQTPMCPESWQRDTDCPVNVRALTLASGRAGSLKSSDLQPAEPSGCLMAPHLLPHAASGLEEEKVMLLPEQVQRLVELALAEFAPEWQVTGLCSELSLHNPDHWVSGLGTFGLILRNRNSRSAKVLGWRSGDFRSATYHRGISYRVLEAYADRITDPIRRYFEEIGLLMPGRAAPRAAPATASRSSINYAG